MCGIIAPVPVPWEIGDRHDCIAVIPRLTRWSSVAMAAKKVPLGVNAPQVKLIQYNFIPRSSFPSGVFPFITGRVNHLAWAMNVVRLETRCRVRHAAVSGSTKEYLVPADALSVQMSNQPLASRLIAKTLSTPSISKCID
jgi:hypothetical protein